MTTPQSAEEPTVRMYRGPLGQMLGHMTYYQQRTPEGAWVRRQLARGATISLGRDPVTRRRVLVISRPTAPRAARGEEMWLNEVHVFLDFFSAMRWEAQAELPPGALEGVTAGVWACYREPER